MDGASHVSSVLSTLDGSVLVKRRQHPERFHGRSVDRCPPSSSHRDFVPSFTDFENPCKHTPPPPVFTILLIVNNVQSFLLSSLSLSLSIPTPLLSLSLPFSPAWLMAGIVARLTRRVTILYPNATQRSLRRHTQTKSSPFLNLSSRLWSLTLGPHSSAEMMQEIANVVFFSSTERKRRWLLYSYSYFSLFLSDQKSLMWKK